VQGQSEDIILRFSGRIGASNFREDEIWPVRIVLRNLAYLAANVRTENPTNASVEELRSWARATRALANRFPYGGSSQREMVAIANDVEHLSTWPTRHSLKPPRGKDSEYRFNVIVWGMDTVRRAARISPRDFWESHLGKMLPSKGGSLTSEQAMEKRLARFKGNLRHSEEAATMGDILAAASEYGPFLPTGELRPSLNPPHRAAETTHRV
jgi:hypothetical protein